MRDMTKKIKCPICGKMFQSLGYASHRAMHRRSVERIKCSICGFIPLDQSGKMWKKCPMCGFIPYDGFISMDMSGKRGKNEKK